MVGSFLPSLKTDRNGAVLFDGYCCDTEAGESGSWFLLHPMAVFGTSTHNGCINKNPENSVFQYSGYEMLSQLVRCQKL